MAAGARVPIGRSAALVAGHPARSPTWFVVRPDRVLRPGARHHPRRRPRSRDPRSRTAPTYGLTAGLHALDPAEIEHWIERVEAGNLYVNRGDHRRDRPTAAVRGLEALGGRADGQGRWAELRGDAVPLERRRALRPRRGHPAIRAVVEHRRFGCARPDRPHRRAQRVPLPAAARRCARSVRCGGDRPPAGAHRRCREDRGLPPGGQRAPRRICRPTVSGACLATGVVRYRAVGVELEDEVVSACHRASVPVDDAPPVAAPEIELPRWLARAVGHDHAAPARPGRERVGRRN